MLSHLRARAGLAWPLPIIRELLGLRQSLRRFRTRDRSSHFLSGARCSKRSRRSGQWRQTRRTEPRLALRTPHNDSSERHTLTVLDIDELTVFDTERPAVLPNLDPRLIGI